MDLPQISTLNTLYPFLDWLKFFNSAFNTSLAGRGGTSMKPNISTEVLVQTDYLLGVRYAQLVMQFHFAHNLLMAMALLFQIVC